MAKKIAMRLNKQLNKRCSPSAKVYFSRVDAATGERVYAELYHAKIDDNEKDRVYDAFMKSKCEFVVATFLLSSYLSTFRPSCLPSILLPTFLTSNLAPGEFVVATDALGLGVDKPDIRQVIIYGAPRSIEDFMQKFGRAGRDNETASCTLFTKPSDFDLYPTSNRTVDMNDFIKTETCRWRTLRHQCKEDMVRNWSCHRCDVCTRGPREPQDFTVEATFLLEVLAVCEDDAGRRDVAWSAMWRKLHAAGTPLRERYDQLSKLVRSQDKLRMFFQGTLAESTLVKAYTAVGTCIDGKQTAHQVSPVPRSAPASHPLISPPFSPGIHCSMDNSAAITGIARTAGSLCPHRLAGIHTHQGWPNAAREGSQG